MRITVLTPWLFAGGLLVAVALLFRANQQKDSELVGAREAVQQAEQVRQDLERMQTESMAQSNELVNLRNQKYDLARLRNEVGQLRQQNQQLLKQIQTAQTETQRAQVQADTAQAVAHQAQASQLADAEKRKKAVLDQQAEYAARIEAVVDANGGRGTLQGQAVAACINNLRQIDGAKHQWALENSKTVSDTPTSEDIKPYLIRVAQRLICPAGGTYFINTMTAMPTCSVQGHVLPNRR